MGGDMDKATGRVKQAVGDLTDDDDLRREGKTDEAAGKTKDVIDKAQRKAEDMVDDVKEKARDD